MASKKKASKGNGSKTAQPRKTAPKPKIHLPSFHYISNKKPMAPLPREFVLGIQELEDALGMRCLLFIQNGRHPDGRPVSIEHSCFRYFFDNRAEIVPDDKVAILIESGGGDPSCAYKLALLLNKHCGGYTALIPSYAKSAATLLSLGSERIIMGKYAELGPLDMQIESNEEETRQSALNHVQALERLGAYSKQTLDEVMIMLLKRTGKKVSSIMPPAIDFTTELVSPMMKNIDVVRYTEMSRLLKVGEEYAERLLRPHYGKDSKVIAEILVSKYPEHGFVIDYEEAGDIGLKVEVPDGKLADAYTKILPYLDEFTAYGFVDEVSI